MLVVKKTSMYYNCFMKENAMSQNKENNFKLEITQDKLVDILMHSATREDIAQLSKKIESTETSLNDKIESLEISLNNKNDRLNDKIESLEKSLTNKMESNFKWTVGILMVAIFAPIVLNFLKLS